MAFNMNPLPPRLYTDIANPSFKLFGQIIPSSPFIAEDAQIPDLIEEIFSPCGVEELGMSSGSSSLSNEADAPKERSHRWPDMAMPDLKEEESKEHGTSKALPRPNKLAPCPRCNSSDTKFCYFNNYNVNQPRYFCKSCQRYWTEGGMLRNVPVGSGRRKNKHGSSFLQKQPFLDDNLMNRVDCGGEQPLVHVKNSSMQENPSVAPETAIPQDVNLENLPQSNSSKAKDPSEAVVQVENEDGSARLEPVRNSEYADFTAPASSCAFPFYGLPWPYAYMAMANAAAAVQSSEGAVYFPIWNGEGLCQWLPASAGGICNPQAWPMPWNLQWPCAAAAAVPPPSSSAGSEDERLLKRRRGLLCVPKTIRIHDTEAAVQKSILTTLGVDNEAKRLVSTGIFSAFQPKGQVFQPQPQPQPGSKAYEEQRHARCVALEERQ